MFLPVLSNHREGDEEAIQHPCRAWNSALEQIHEQHLWAVEQTRQHYPGCWAVPGSGRRVQAMPRQAALTRVCVKKSLTISMSEVGCVVLCSFSFPFHSGASNWAPKWRWHMAQADPAVKVSEPFPCSGSQMHRKGKREGFWMRWKNEFLIQIALSLKHWHLVSSLFDSVRDTSQQGRERRREGQSW